MYEHKEPQKTSDGNEKRNIWRRPILPEPVKIEHGNLNPELYKDGVGKDNQPKECLTETGTNKYFGPDGCTTDWFDTHSRDEKQRGNTDGAGRRLGRG